MSAPNLKHGRVMETITVSVYEDNALSVTSSMMAYPDWMIVALENAIDAIRNQHKPKDKLIIPAKDVTL